MQKINKEEFIKLIEDLKKNPEVYVKLANAEIKKNPKEIMEFFRQVKVEHSDDLRTLYDDKDIQKLYWDPAVQNSLKDVYNILKIVDPNKEVLGNNIFEDDKTKPEG